jgi:hypothetical protein
MPSKQAFGWAALLSATAAALTLGAVAAPAGATATRAATPAAAPTAAPDVPAVAAPAFPGRLYSVTAISASDVWAVGLGNEGTLELHFNGSKWTQSPVATKNGYFDGVASTSAGNVWAVGGTNWFSPSQTLADHWNGSKWTRFSTPGSGYFNAVAATSTTNAWAVGLMGPGPGIVASTTPLIEHWNGRNWTEQSLKPVPGGGQFTGVAATSASNAWAVGQTDSADPQTLIEHWNGKNWTRISSPNVADSTASNLKSVTAISSDNAWAVGSTSLGGSQKALTIHWDGKRWTIIPGNNPGGDVALLGVLATWTNNIWAVGFTNPSTCSNGGPKCQSLIEHWNGARWKVLPSPNPPSLYLNLLWAAAATSRYNIWAVGTTDYGSTLIVHWNGAAWS